MANLQCVQIQCDLCSHSARATVGDEVLVLRLEASDWSSKCQFRSEVLRPMRCDEFLKALQNAALGLVVAGPSV